MLDSMTAATAEEMELLREVPWNRRVPRPAASERVPAGSPRRGIVSNSLSGLQRVPKCAAVRGGIHEAFRIR
jgi:hypothetical protein